MFYNARWYDPSLGRFAQADSIVPGGMQGLDRYAYVNNNPLRYVDPSGHEHITPCELNRNCSSNLNAMNFSDTHLIQIPAESSREKIIENPQFELPKIIGPGCGFGTRIPLNQTSNTDAWALGMKPIVMSLDIVTFLQNSADYILPAYKQNKGFLPLPSVSIIVRQLPPII